MFYWRRLKRSSIHSLSRAFPEPLTLHKIAVIMLGAVTDYDVALDGKGATLQNGRQRRGARQGRKVCIKAVMKRSCSYDTRQVMVL